MEFLDIFALIILVLMIVAVLYIWIWAAMLPGKIAKKRGHPQAEAINIAGWMGALLGMVLWPLALTWAFTKPVLAPIDMKQGGQGAKAKKGAAS
ncbi:MAG: DUF3302 domain-containing protein [Sphingomonadales bacterium]